MRILRKKIIFCVAIFISTNSFSALAPIDECSWPAGTVLLVADNGEDTAVANGKIAVLKSIFPIGVVNIIGKLSQDEFHGEGVKAGWSPVLSVTKEQIEDPNSIRRCPRLVSIFPVTQDSPVENVQEQIAGKWAIPVARQIFVARGYIGANNFKQISLAPCDLSSMVVWD